MRKPDIAKYIAVVDYRATFKPMTLTYHKLTANNIVDAMREVAPAFSWENADKVYLISLLEFSGAEHNQEWEQAYNASYRGVLENRGHGWNVNEPESWEARGMKFLYCPDGKIDRL